MKTCMGCFMSTTLTMHILLLTIILSGMGVSSATTTVLIPVNTGVDAELNTTACAVAHENPEATDACSLRSAFAYCSTLMLMSTDNCYINITSPDLTINSEFGEIAYFASGALTIEGNGGSITGSTSSRLLNISSSVHDLRFSFNHIRCFNFGGSDSSLAGGVIHFDGLSEVSLTDVVFSNNTAHTGAALAFSNCSGVQLEQCVFKTNRAETAGAVIFARMNRNVRIGSCHFRDNNATARCGGLCFGDDNEDIFVYDSVLQRNYAGDYGGALAIKNSNRNIAFVSTLVIQNVAGWNAGGLMVWIGNSNVSFTSCEFLENTAVGNDGGAVYVNGVNEGISFVNTTVSYNRALADSGGGIYMWKFNSNVSFIDTVFSFNEAADSGGGMFFYNYNNYIVVRGSSFIGNTADSVGGGVSVNSNNENLLFESSTFRDNSVRLYGAGISFAASNSRADFLECQFLNNSVQYDGGAINFYQNNFDFYFYKCTFSHNTGVEGGAISLYEANYLVTFDDCDFSDNIAEVKGAAVLVNLDNDDIHVLNCRITDNTALFGAGIHLNDGNNDFLMADSIITGNVATDGGGVYVHSYNDRVVFRQCFIALNSAAYEGGGLFLESYNANLTAHGITFLHNVAGDSGGGAFIFQFNEHLLFDNMTFESNLALTSGGGLTVHSANLHSKVVDSLFRNNTSGDVGGAFSILQRNFYLQFIRVIVMLNGAVGMGGGGCLWEFNDYASFTNCSFINNGATFDGGGVYAYRYNNHISFIGTSFKANEAFSDDGGGVFLKFSNSDVYFSHCVFERNKAKTSGGAIAVRSNNEDMRIEDSVFLNNNALSDGGGVYCYAGNDRMTLLRLMLEGNSAENGGGLFLGDDHMSFAVQQSSFVNNTAELGGGAVLGWYAEDLLVEGCDFSGNSAMSVGGLLIRSEDAVVRTSLFRQNMAEDNAGMFISTSVGRIEQCTFEANVASGFVSGLLLSESFNIVLTDVVFRGNIAAFAAGGMGILKGENIVVRDAHFEQNSGEEGGGILVVYGKNISIVESKFFGCSAQRGAAVKLSGTDSVLVQGNNFTNNIASSSGAVNVLDCDHIIMSSNLFDSNIAQEGYGSAVALYGGTDVSLTHSRFVNNSAPRGAGTVYWNTKAKSEPLGLTGATNMFSDSNTALYGPRWATEGIQIVLPGSTVYVVEDYDLPVPPVEVHLVDYYGQTVSTDSDSFVEIAVGEEHTCGDSAGTISGGVFKLLERGLVNFTSLTATCAPGFNQTLKIFVENSLFGTAIIAPDLTLSFRSCNRGEFYQDKACQPCPTGTYSFTESEDVANLQQTSVCQRCPDEATLCYADIIVLESGYWRPHDTSDYILECPLAESACLGGVDTSDESCREGYTGPLCAVCEEGYHFSSLSQTCELCSETTSWVGAAVISFSLVILVSALSLYLVRLKRSVGAETFTDLLTHFLVKWGYISLDLNKTKRLWLTEYIRLQVIKRMQVRVRIYVTFYQILEILPFVLDLSFPSFYNVIASMMSLLNLDFSSDTLAASECSSWNSGSHDFIDKLLLSTTYPFGVLGVALLAQHLHIYIQRRNSGELLSHDTILSIQAKYQKACLVFMSLVLPGISSIIFATFSCTDVNSEDNSEVYMTVDYSITCYSERYYFAFTWALFMVAVYPIGVPCYYFLLLRQHKDDITSRDRTASIKDKRLEGIKFLFEVYRPCYWYWEVVEMFFRLSMTAMLVLLNQGSTQQIVIGIFFSLIFIKIYDIFLPYADREIKSVKEISLWQIFFIFAFAFGIKTKMLESASDGVIILLLMVMVFANLFVDIVKLCFFVYGIRRKGSRTESEADQTTDTDNDNDTDADAVTALMSADELDHQILAVQVKLAELAAVKRSRLRSLWGRKSEKSRPSDVESRRVSDAVISPLAGARAYDSSGLEMNTIA